MQIGKTHKLTLLKLIFVLDVPFRCMHLSYSELYHICGVRTRVPKGKPKMADFLGAIRRRSYSYIHVMPDRFLFKLRNLNLI